MFRTSTEREAKRVQIFMDEANPNDKTIIFCATQVHAAAVRDLVNQYKGFKDANYYLSGTENNGFIIWVGFIHKNLNPFGFALLDFNDVIEICFFV
jgi:hypothetical protein